MFVPKAQRTSDANTHDMRVKNLMNRITAIELGRLCMRRAEQRARPVVGSSAWQFSPSLLIAMQH
jgi:hypothetical protein